MADEEKDAENNVAGKVEKRKRSGKKGGTPKKQGDESEEKKPRKHGSKSIERATPGIVRPARERKSVERFTDLSTEKPSASKGVSIEKGSGTQLKDIPNVAFKLSKRKSDETLQMLHTILYGRRSKVYQLKRNINQFSGFVWVENEEKRRVRVKEKIDKCVKDKLFDICDVLDIPVSKATIKEELSAKLLEFLESPHATTEVSLAEKEQSLKAKKRKRRAKGSGETSGEVPAERSAKKSKKSHEITVVEKGQKGSSKAEEQVEDEGESADDEDASSDAPDGAVQEEESEHMESESEDDRDNNEEKDHRKSKKGAAEKGVKKGSEAKISVKSTPVKKSSPAKLAKGPTKSVKSPSKSVKSPSEKGVSVDDSVSVSPSKSKEITAKIQKENKKKTQKSQKAPAEEKNSKKKQTKKAVVKVAAKEKGKGKATAKAKVEPSREEMLSAVSDILKEVDFNTATLSDILRQLGTHFDMDLMHRKTEVKSIIEEVINSMSDGEDGEENNDEEEGGDAEESEEESDA